MQVAEIQVTYSHKIKASDRPLIRSSETAHQILREKWSNLIDYQEEFNILLMDRSNRVLGIYNVSKGGIHGTVVDAKIVFAAALKSRACNIILAHNHPSGNLDPSSQDIELTNKLVAGSKLLDIQIQDHIILTPDCDYFSFADNELI